MARQFGERFADAYGPNVGGDEFLVLRNGAQFACAQEVSRFANDIAGDDIAEQFRERHDQFVVFRDDAQQFVGPAARAGPCAGAHAARRLFDPLHERLCGEQNGRFVFGRFGHRLCLRRWVFEPQFVYDFDVVFDGARFAECFGCAMDRAHAAAVEYRRRPSYSRSHCLASAAIAVV